MTRRREVTRHVVERGRDHTVPKSKRAASSYSNAQVLSREENLAKGAN